MTKINFAKMNGLIPVVIQDYQNHKVLMAGFMNEQAWRLTQETGKVHYYSRKKKRIWMKGEESGHFQHVKEIYLDCDNDTLLIKVKQIKAACHTGYYSCFHKLIKGSEIVDVGQPVCGQQESFKDSYQKIVLAIASGSLYLMTTRLLKSAGYRLHLGAERFLRPKITNDNINLVVARAQEIPKLVEEGKVDIGLTGIDMVDEYDVSITDLIDLRYNEKGRGEILWALAVPKEDKYKYTKLTDFESKRIQTELVNTTRKYFLEHNIRVSIELSIGATEAKAPFFCDAIVDLVDTGRTLRVNGLEPIYTIRSSTVHLIAHNRSMAYGWKRRKIEEITEKLKKAASRLPNSPGSLIELPKAKE